MALLLMSALGWLSSTSITSAQEQPLAVEGQVFNATSGGGGVAGLTVVLHQESATRHDHLEKTTDAEGRFRFEGIVFDPAAVYGVSVTYQGALYGIDLDLSAGSPPPVSLPVYEATNSDEMLSASSASVLFAGADVSRQTVSVLEIVKLTNDSDRAYVPGPQPMQMLRFGLPDRAHGLKVDTNLLGADFVQVDRGFALLASVPPGDHEVMYAYEVPYSGAEAVLTKSLRYGAEYLRVLAPREFLKLSSDQLGEPRSIAIGGRAYQLLEASDVPKGTQLSVRLEGLPQPSLSDRTRRTLDAIRFEYVAPVSLAMLMALLVGYALWRRSRQRRALETSSVPAPSQEREALRLMLSDLEQRFESGALTEEEYYRRRRLLEARLASQS